MSKIKVLHIVLISIMILNIFDGVFTTYWVESEKATEANPLMEVLVESPVQFMVVKISLVSLGVLLLWRLKNKRPKSILVCSFILLLLFSCIFVYHIWAFINPEKIASKITNITQTRECIKEE